MKTVILGMCGIGAGGAAFYGMNDAPDFDRVVKRSPAAVYAAFSALAQEGTITPPQQGDGPRLSFQVTKVTGESIHYEVRMNERPVVEVDLGFAAAGEDGRQTRLTAELELDEFELGAGFETEAGMALSMVPEQFVDRQFANLMDDAVRDLEAGRPLAPLGLNRLGMREARRGALTPAGVRAETRASQRAAVRPTQSARPMVDPNGAAAAYRSGAPAAGGDWGR